MSSDPVITANVQQTEQLADVDRVNEFFNSREIKEDLHWFTYRDTLERAFRRNDRRLYYTESRPEKRLSGALMVWCESRVLDADEAQIRLVAVHPDYRHQGLGSLLCERAEEFARSQRKSVMVAVVAAESPAVSFWDELGYSESDAWETNNGRSMLQVSKLL